MGIATGALERQFVGLLGLEFGLKRQFESRQPALAYRKHDKYHVLLGQILLYNVCVMLRTGENMSPYQILVRHPHAFPHATGLSLTAFEALYQLFEPVWLQREHLRLGRDMARRQALGAGRRYTVAAKEQLLAVCLWLHLALHPQEVATLHHIHISTLARYQRRVLVVLRQVPGPVPAWSIPTPSTYRSLDQVVQACPSLAVLRQHQTQRLVRTA